MSWDRTYSHSLALGVDMLGAVVLFNRPDLSISSLARIVQLADSHCADFPERLRSLKLSNWQVKALRWLAKRLDQVTRGPHCESARTADLERARSTVALLSYTRPPIQP